MITALFLTVFLGFFLCYQTSKRAKLNKNLLIEKIAQENPHYAKVIGLLLNIIALLGCAWYFGLGSGIFAFFIMLMTAGSLIVLLAPTRFISYKLTTLLFLFSLTVELIFS